MTDFVHPALPRPLPVRLGFGCGDLYGGAHASGSQRLIWAALDAGIRYFDVARLYGDGSAEAVVGRALAEAGEEVVVASKVGIVPWSMRTRERIARKALTTAARLAPPARRVLPAAPHAAAKPRAFSLSEMRRSVEASLKALGRERLDILLLHEPAAEDVARPQTRDFLHGLRAEGKIGAFGVAATFAETMRIAAAGPPLGEVVQFASDAQDRNVETFREAFPPDLLGDPLAITHSAIRNVLPRLASAEGVEGGAGGRPAGREDLVRLLLADALARNAGGLVLFSTSRPERVAGAVKATAVGDERLAAFRARLDATTLP